jgi:ketosteroid isomerase-like protein
MSQENVETVRGVRIVLPSSDERASRGRSLDERLSVRFPALFRLLSAAVTPLSTRSRLRRLVVARRVSQTYAAVNRRDFDVTLVGFDPAIEYRPSSDLMPPDLDPVMHGHDGFLKLWRYWMDAFQDLRWDPEEILDFGDRLLVTAQQSGHGSGSGVAVSEPVFQLFTLRGGLVIRQEDFLDRSKALEAAGLRE